MITEKIKSTATGLKELETGIVCIDNYQARGRKKTEELIPQLEQDISDLNVPKYIFSIE